MHNKSAAALGTTGTATPSGASSVHDVGPSVRTCKGLFI